MKKITIQMIRSWDPCYDPTTILPKNWAGTILDILQTDKIPPADKLWLVCREELIDAKTLREFAIWCAEQARKYIPPEDQLCYLNILEIIRQYNNGEQPEEIRSAAGYAARSAAQSDARSAARSVAWYAWSAARSAARSATRYAARSAAWYAARSAAQSDARSAAQSDARYAARYAAQIEKLIELIQEKK